MKRPVFLYSLQLPPHTPEQLRAKVRTMKALWLATPAISLVSSGTAFSDPGIAVLFVMAWWSGSVALYYLIRFCFYRPSLRPGCELKRRG